MLILTIITLIFSALFSGTEIAFITGDRVRAQIEGKRGGLISRIINRFYDNSEFFISTILVGNNVMLVIYGMGAAAIIEPFLGQYTQNEFLILLFQTLISTLVILLTGEFLPKTIFKINPNSSLRIFALPVYIFYILLYPISLFTTWISRMLMKLAGADTDKPRLTLLSVQNYVSLISPDKRDIVKLYQSQQPIFDAFGITRQIKSSFGKTVSFRSGAYIIIESTEACHVVDVNSGNRTKASNDQETNALEVNLRAADEIARQLRLRDMGGIIVVDFIDMNKGEHRQQLYEHMREIMANDRARHNILPLSKFGLMQITRQRVRPALTITTAETCPSCFGKGVVQPSLLFTDTLDEKLDYVVNTLELRDFVMYVHPFVDAYIKRGIFTSLYGKWRRKYGRVFKILPDESLAYLQYRVLDKENNEIDLKEEKDMNASTADKVNNKTRKRTQDPSTEGLTDLEIAEGVVETPAPAKPQKPADAPAVETEDSPAETAPAKKRRRRKKKTASTADETQPEANVTDTEAVATAQESESQPQAEPQIKAPTESEQQEAPTKPKRRRRPKAKTNPDAGQAGCAASASFPPAREQRNSGFNETQPL